MLFQSISIETLPQYQYQWISIAAVSCCCVVAAYISCLVKNRGTRKIVETHLLVYGIIRNYTFWYHHGERLGEPLLESESEYEDEEQDGEAVEECESEDEVEELLRDLYPNLDGGITYTDCDDLLKEEPNVEAKVFYSLLKDFELPLYQNSKASKLSSLIKLLHIKRDAIDTHLQPLIQELKELWEVGIETYVASTKQNFKLHSSLLWTINDFPAYGNLSGWSTKGKLACPCCNKDTASIRLTNGVKDPRELEVDELKNCDEVAQLHKGDDNRIIEDLLSLSRGPTKYSTHSNGYVVNGYRFHVQDYDKKLRTQNCGIVVLGENDEDSENLDNYGVLTNVIELFLKTNELFVLVDQASQVFYADDNSNKGWQVVRKTQPRDSYEIVEQMDDDIVGIRMMHKNFMPFEARSTRNATNRAKLKMLHHIGSKPIREIIYQKGGKDDNPPDLTTIFFETRKKDNKLVEPEAIEKHVRLTSNSYRSHVFGFGGGVKTKDLKGGTSSKAKLFYAQRSTQEDIKSLNEQNKSLNEENKSLNDRLSTIEDEMKEIMKMKEFFTLENHMSHLQHHPSQLNDHCLFS
ncbi:hypothetical protein MTR67_013319 [Solanum verrucosum]|uniref:Uncharacterized protein n=1 Tax=Solanum verrucosum TaxID=315347 RepID=A0AAF0QA91_SOLVR|nr:hypothetical protein MTR67_013319 [Solanum verrucosum]